MVNVQNKNYERGAFIILDILMYNNYIINFYVELFDFFNKSLEIKKKFDKITQNFKGFKKKKDIKQMLNMLNNIIEFKKL